MRNENDGTSGRVGPGDAEGDSDAQHDEQRNGPVYPWDAAEKDRRVTRMLDEILGETPTTPDAESTGGWSQETLSWRLAPYLEQEDAEDNAAYVAAAGRRDLLGVLFTRTGAVRALRLALIKLDQVVHIDEHVGVRLELLVSEIASCCGAWSDEGEFLTGCLYAIVCAYQNG